MKAAIRLVLASTAPLLACAMVLPAAAQTAPAAPGAQPPQANILDRAINTPGSNWAVYGAGQTSKMGKTTGVPGNEAMHVVVTAQGAHPWDVGALSPIQKPIAAADVVLVAVYLRAPELADGATAPIAFLGATASDAPYDTIAGQAVTITKNWKLYYASGKAPKAFAAGTARVSVQLAAAKAVVELGPVFVLNFGANYDTWKLPQN